MQGKVALITGGASGIGESTVRLFVQNGAKVLIADVQDKLGESLAQELGLPETISFVHCNITSDSDVQNAVDTAISRYGQLDIMYNNAGIGGNLETTILNSDNADFKRVLEINLFGSFLGAKHAARVMIPARKGCILFTGSVAASISGDLSYAYKASKHAILGLNNNLTVELGKYGIRVNTISPYGVATPMVTSGMQMDKKAAEEFMSAAGNLRGAILEPEDVAKAALYLASDDAKLQGKVALITGGASGIGESTVRLFVQNGAKVLIADVQDKLGESLAQELGLPETISFVHCNITSDSDVQNAVDTAISRYGQLDIMYNNAGIGGNLETTILNSDNADFKRVLEINLFGSFLGAKHAARVMIPARKGCILFTGSVAASISGDLSYAYKASKHAILGLNNNLTVELGKYGIRVNTISPYGVATPMVTSGMQMDKKAAEEFMSAAGNLRGAILEPEDVAKAALYLASDDAKLQGKVALITGGASGIGESTVRLFVQNGAKVLIADVQDKLGESLAQELGLPETISFVHCNITSDSDVQNAVDTAISRYGQLDIMYNNAGIGGNLETTILNSDNADFKRVLEINLFGSFLGAKHAARVMIPARKGCILFTGSVAASISGDLSYAYKASKHAILGLNNNLTVELGKYGIRVNTISPYGVATPMVTSGMQMDKKAAEEFMSAAGNLRGAILEPEDVAKAALYLASDDAKYDLDSKEEYRRVKDSTSQD
ncbi:Short chain aldehyde dehydrogenase 1 [Linum perenne]